MLVGIVVIANGSDDRVQGLGLHIQHFQLMLRIVALYAFPGFLHSLNPFKAQETAVGQTDQLPAGRKHADSRIQQDIEIRFRNIAGDVGHSFKDPLIRVFDTRNHYRYLIRQGITAMGQCEESLIAGSHNQVRFPLPGTLADAAHDEALGSERPVIGIQIFSSDIGFNSSLVQSVLQIFCQKAVPRSIFCIGLYEKYIVRTFRSRKCSRHQPQQACKQWKEKAFHHNIDFVYSTQNSYSSRKYTSYIENEHRLFKKNSLIVQCFGRLYLHGP